MKILDRLERKIGRVFIPNLTLLLAFGQVALYLLAMMRTVQLHTLALVPAKVMAGEAWRLITFPFVPVLSNMIFFAFAIYLFILMGGALEAYWGGFRYNLFLLIGYLATVAVSFATSLEPASNAFIYGSVFLAFAFLNPDFILQLFFVMPVQIKWLALITWIGYGAALIFGTWPMRLRVLAAVGNFFVFFLPDLTWRLRHGGRQMRWQARVAAARRDGEPFHRCAVCGATDRSHPEMIFRYCKACAGNLGYCQEHFPDHPHVAAAPTEAAQ